MKDIERREDLLRRLRVLMHTISEERQVHLENLLRSIVATEEEIARLRQEAND